MQSQLLYMPTAAYMNTDWWCITLVYPEARYVALPGLQGQILILHTAAQWGHPRVVDLLLSHGANQNTMFKVSPFHRQAAVDITHSAAHNNHHQMPLCLKSLLCQCCSFRIALEHLPLSPCILETRLSIVVETLS